MSPNSIGSRPSRWLSGLAGLASLFYMGSASALAAPGSGLEFGSLRFSPHIGASWVYDSNVYLANEQEMADREYPSGSAIQVNPGFTARYLNERVEGQFGYEHYMKHYLLPAHKPLRYYDNLAARGSLVLFPKGVFGMTLREQFRINSFVNQGAATAVDETTSEVPVAGLNYQKRFNDLAGTLRYSPGGALDFFAGGSWYAESYISRGGFFPEEDETEVDSFVDKDDYGVEGRVRWKFFPRTYLVWDAQYHWIVYELLDEEGLVSSFSADVDGDGNNEDVRIYRGNPTTHWWTRVGLQGQFTAALQAVAMIGYSQIENVLDEADDLKGVEGIVGHVTLAWTPHPTQSASISYLRTPSDFFLSDYLITNSLTLQYSGIYFDRLSTGLQLSYESRAINAAPSVVTENETVDGETVQVPSSAQYQDRFDTRYRTRFNLGYRVAPWLSTEASYVLTLLDSSEPTTEYTQHLLTIGLNATY